MMNKVNVALVFCSGVGRVQPFVPQLLHGTVGQAEQPMSSLPEGLGRFAHWLMFFHLCSLLTLFKDPFIPFSRVTSAVQLRGERQVYNVCKTPKALVLWLFSYRNFFNHRLGEGRFCLCISFILNFDL